MGLFNEFKHFITENELIGTAAGFTIGSSAKSFITSIVSLLFIQFQIEERIQNGNVPKEVRSVIVEGVSFLAVIVATFVVLRFIIMPVVK